MALLRGSLRKARKPGEHAEDDVLAQLSRELPGHWVTVGLIPPRRAREGEKKYSCKEIDAIVIADRLIYVVEIKSHQGLVRVRPAHPFQLNGLDIQDAGNQGTGFWDNHDRQCNQIKRILKIKLDIPSNCIVPRFIWAG
ncbi:MAG TPA: nuclease-related domain-containing protein [Allosphingosinicella sp.]